MCTTSRRQCASDRTNRSGITVKLTVCLDNAQTWPQRSRERPTKFRPSGTRVALAVAGVIEPSITAMEHVARLGGDPRASRLLRPAPSAAHLRARSERVGDRSLELLQRALLAIRTMRRRWRKRPVLATVSYFQQLGEPSRVSPWAGDTNWLLGRYATVATTWAAPAQVATRRWTGGGTRQQH